LCKLNDTKAELGIAFFEISVW